MKKIKDSIAGILYRLLLIVVKLLPAKTGTKHLLIIKLDEIGDYMLFRNNLKYFKESAKYKDYRITLLGNAAWKSIFDEYDSDTVDDTIWITKKQFNRNLKYRFNMLRAVRNCGASEVVNAVYSRSITLEDGFAFVANCENKIGMVGDNSNIGNNAINFQRYVYSTLVDAGDKTIFDSIRNKVFLQSILNNDRIVSDSKLGIPWNGKHSNHIAIFIGAGNPERRWPIEFFKETCEYVWEKYGLSTIVLGGKPDEDIATVFTNGFQGEADNRVAKTSLLDLIYIFNNAKFAISVDTGPLHIAVSTGCPVVGLFSGKYYKRYSPYPKEITNHFYPIYPDFIDSIIATNDPIIYDPFKTSNDTIKYITPEKAIKTIDVLLNETV